MDSITTTFQSFSTAARAGSLGASETWGTVANAQTSNDQRAAYSNMTLGPQTGHTHWLQGKNLTDKVPAGKVIKGIVAHIERRKSAADGTIQDDAVQLIKDNVVSGEDRSLPTTYTTSDVTLDYGQAPDEEEEVEGDLWGLELTDEDVNGDGFGLAYSASIDLGFDPSWPEIDRMGVTIYFDDPPSSGAVNQSKSCVGVGVGIGLSP